MAYAMQGGKMKTIKLLALVACLLLILSGGVFAQEDAGVKFTVLGGLDMFGNLTIENDDADLDEDEDSNIGIFLGAEAAMPLSETFLAGLGLRYQFPRELDVDDSDDFGFIPVYALFQLNFPIEGNLVPYIVGHIGYNFFIYNADNLEDYLSSLAGEDVTVDSEGGLYWGIGGGVYITENVSIQALYNINYGVLTAESDSDSLDIDVTYSKLTIAAAYTF